MKLLHMMCIRGYNINEKTIFWNCKAVQGSVRFSLEKDGKAYIAKKRIFG